MNRGRRFSAWWLAALVAVSACSRDKGSGGPGEHGSGDRAATDRKPADQPQRGKPKNGGHPGDRGPGDRGKGNGSAGKADPLADPKTAIAYQLELLKAGEVDKLRACFTPRLRSRITSEAVENARQEAADLSVDDLVGSVQPGEYRGKRTAKIKMKNGKTLTVLLLINGQWLADTKWFR